MRSKAVNLKDVFIPKYRDALVAAALATNKFISNHRMMHETWTMMPGEEKANLLRSRLFNDILESLKALGDDVVSTIHLGTSGMARVNLIGVAGIGLHLIHAVDENNLPDEGDVLRRHHLNKKRRPLFAEIDGEPLSETNQLEIFECVYKKKGSQIIELVILDRHNDKCEPMRLDIIASTFAPTADNEKLETPSIKLKSSVDKNDEGGKDVAL